MNKTRADGFSDLSFFTLLIKHPSLAAAAQQLGLTPPAVSKRLAQLEARLGVRLLNRTTRRTSLTPEGEVYLAHGSQVLEALEALERRVSGHDAKPKGTVRVGATLGFGRRQLAPTLSAFSDRFPDIEVQLHLDDRVFNLVEQGLDLVVRFGEPPDARLSARCLANNTRLLCASPDYLRRAGVPENPRTLAQHACIFIRESDETFGTWHMRHGAQTETVKVRGSLSTNDGETALSWAVDGHGIVLRSQWDAAALLRAGRLIQVLPQWHFPPADVYLLFQPRASLKVRVLIDFLVERFAAHRNAGGTMKGNW